MTVSITGLVNTRNAAETLDLCLASLTPHVDELLVVDMHSSDETVAIAASFGARVLLHEPLGYVEPARAFGIREASHEWILILDADEILPRPLGRRLREVADRDEADVITFSWRNYFFGDAASHGPLGPAVDRHRRFFRRSMLVHSPRIHVPAEPAPGARELVLPPTADLCVTHLSYVDVSDWLIRSDRYTTIEAQHLMSDGRHVPRSSSMLFEVVRTFLAGYLGRRGYRDGWRGFHLCLLLAHYRLTVGLKAQQLERAGTPEEIRNRYRELATELLQS